jgi:hypothetical protein
MDGFQDGPKPTILSSVNFNGVTYEPGMERALAASGLPLADFRRLADADVIIGFEGVLPKAGSAFAGPGPEEEAEEIELPPVSKLAEFLQGYDSADEVRQIKDLDTRKSAQDLYDARIAELEG